MQFSKPQEKEEKIDYKSSLKLIYSLSSPYKKDFFIAFIYLMFSTGLTLLIPLIAKYAIDNPLKNKNFLELVFCMIIYFITASLFLFFNYLSSMKLIKTGQKLIVNLKEKLFSHLLNLDMEYYSLNPIGKIAARVQSDTSSLYELFTETVVSIFKDIVMFFAIFIIISFYNFDLTKVLFPLVLIIIILIRIFISLSSSSFVSVRKIISEISGFLSENLNFMSTIQSFNREKYSQDKLLALNSKKLNYGYKAETFAILFFMTVLLFDPISKTSVFFYGGKKVLLGEMSIGVIIMFILYLNQLFEPIFRFSEHITIIQKSFSAGHRINEILNKKINIINKGENIFIDNFNDKIEFKNISMRYKEDLPWTLKNISFTLKKGETLAIVGKTGGGKSTITNLLLRFNDYQKGEILIDNEELKSINLSSLRKLIGLVQQDIYLFPATIMQNLKLMDEKIPDDRIHFAIKTLELEYFYKKHPLNKFINEKGNNLSIGEKQIIALTRTMVLDQSILIMDEATSNIDPYTEKLITKAIKNIMKHKTMIIIAHRLSTIESADKILFLHNGEILEEGTHNELLNKKGFYNKFYILQTEI